MRRYPSATMASKHKPYEMVGRPATHSYGQPSQQQKSRFIKFIAAMIVAAMLLYCVHGFLSPSEQVYGLMIDAGSTGSRIHTYTFRKHSPSEKLKVIQEDFFALKPGLSSYKDNPEEAAKSLEPLLERAKSKIPKSKYATTPVVLRATAGLRMTGEQAANAILTKVRTSMKNSGFRFDNDNWATILSGNEEAIYSWMTVNYLLGRNSAETVGTLEMGGGSAQIAYVPKTMNNEQGLCNISSENLQFNGNALQLYTISHLDYGLQKARSILLKRFRDGKKLSSNPCFNGGSGPIDVKIPFDEPESSISFSNGLGDYKACQDLILQMFIDPSIGECKCNQCTYHGAAQPTAIKEFVAIAFYLERTVGVGMTSPLTVADIDSKAAEICKMSIEQVTEKYPNVQNGVATDLCLDMAYISLHLQRGHGIKPDSSTKLSVLNKINNFELGWCLGAMQQTMSKLYGSSSN